MVLDGADLEPGTLLAAYRAGLFPMRLGGLGGFGRRIGWWSPDPRGIIPLDGLHVSRTLRRSCRDFEVRVDTAFEHVMKGCADPKRPHTSRSRRTGLARRSRRAYWRSAAIAGRAG